MKIGNWKLKILSFTLIETAVIVLSITILLTITFSLFSFRQDFWLVKQKSFNFAKDLNRVRELSFQGLSEGNQKICGTGLLIDKARNQYLGVAYRANLNVTDCFSLPSANFNLTASADPENDSNIYKITKFFRFTTANSNLLKAEWNKALLEVRCVGNCAPVGAGLVSFDRFQIMLKNPYADPVIFYRQGAGGGEITPWDQITFTLKYKNDSSIITLYKNGQIVFK